MKKILLLAFMALLAFASQAQRWEWVKGYGASEDKGNEIVGTVTDSEGNLYILGMFRNHAKWNGEMLLSDLHPGGNGTHVLIAKLSPQGEMVWKKVISSQASCQAYDIKKVGDTAFACMVDFVGPNSAYSYCWLDTLIVGGCSDYPMPWEIPSLPMNRFIGAPTTVYLKFGFDGTLLEQHFFHLTYVDNYGEDIGDQSSMDNYFYLWANEMVDARFDIDSAGNIYVLRLPVDETASLLSENTHSVWNGLIPTVKIWVDNRVAGTIDTRHRPKDWYPHLMKFSPHFDTLLDNRYIIQDCINGHANGRPKISLRLDKNSNIYITMISQPIFDSMNHTQTMIFDSLQGMAADIDLYDAENGYLLVYDSLLHIQRMIYLKAMTPEMGGFKYITGVSFDYDSNLVFVPGFYTSRFECDYDRADPMALKGNGLDTTVYLYNDCFAFKFDLDTWEYKGLIKPPVCKCSLGGNIIQYANIVTTNNRVFMQIEHSGDITLPSGTFHAPVDLYFTSSLVIFDYAGNVIGGDHTRQFSQTGRRRNGPLALVDSVLYVVQHTNFSATFGDITVNPSGWYCYVAKLVDTSFMTPYVYVPPVEPPEEVTEAAADNAMALYPNPTTGEMRLKAAEGRVLAASIVSASGVRQPTAVDGDRIDVSRLSAGIYFVTVTTDTGIYTVKFVKR